MKKFFNDLIIYVIVIGGVAIAHYLVELGSYFKWNIGLTYCAGLLTGGACVIYGIYLIHKEHKKEKNIMNS